MGQQLFQFKKFKINQDQCAMKVGTDAVLLGAWVDVSNQQFSVLDIGAGTGVLSLMLAQRCQAEILDAIEIDANAFEQCVENFEASSWSDRLFCYHTSLNEFVNEVEDTYDLIVSNPPFYSEDYKTNQHSRDTARFQDALSFKDLVKNVSKLLAEHGTFSVIIPYKEEAHFITLASSVKLFPFAILHVKGHQDAEVKRSLMALSFRESEIKISELIIETKRHHYTQDYITLTKDFYLNM